MGFNLGESTKKKGSFNLGDKSDITYVTLMTTDGKEFGDISYRAYRAIENNTLDSYTPINDEEKNLLDKYKKWMEDVQTAETKERQEKIDSYKTTAKEKLANVEKEKSTVSDDIYQLRREKAAAKRSTGLLTTDKAEKWKTEDTRTGIEKREGKSIPDSAGTKELKKLESEYAKIDEKADAFSLRS